MVEGEKQLLKIDSDQHGWAEVCLYLHTLAILYYTQEGRERGREDRQASKNEISQQVLRRRQRN